MSDNTLKPLEVTRNAVTLTFSPTDYLRGKRKAEGLQYLSPGDVNKDTLQDYIKWLGEDDFYGMVNAISRKNWIDTQDAVLENNQGTYSDVLHKQYLEELSTRGETLEDIDNKLKAANNEMIELLPKVSAAQANNDLAAQAALMGEFMKITEQVKKLTVAYNSKKRAPRKTKEEEVEANS